MVFEFIENQNELIDGLSVNHSVLYIFACKTDCRSLNFMARAMFPLIFNLPWKKAC